MPWREDQSTNVPKQESARQWTEADIRSATVVAMDDDHSRIRSSESSVPARRQMRLRSIAFPWRGEPGKSCQSCRMVRVSQAFLYVKAPFSRTVSLPTTAWPAPDWLAGSMTGNCASSPQTRTNTGATADTLTALRASDIVLRSVAPLGDGFRRNASKCALYNRTAMTPARSLSR